MEQERPITNCLFLAWVGIGAFIGVPYALIVLFTGSFGYISWPSIIYLVIYGVSLIFIFGNKSFMDFIKRP